MIFTAFFVENFTVYRGREGTYIILHEGSEIGTGGNFRLYIVGRTGQSDKPDIVGRTVRHSLTMVILSGSDTEFSDQGSKP